MAYKETRKWVESVSALFRCREEYSNATIDTTSTITNNHQQSPTITNNHQQHIQPQPTPRLPCATYPQRVPQHAGVDGAKPTGQTLHQCVSPRQRGVHVAQARGGVQAGRTQVVEKSGERTTSGKRTSGKEEVKRTTSGKEPVSVVLRVTIENEYNKYNHYNHYNHYNQ